LALHSVWGIVWEFTRVEVESKIKRAIFAKKMALMAEVEFAGLVSAIGALDSLRRLVEELAEALAGRVSKLVRPPENLTAPPPDFLPAAGRLLHFQEQLCERLLVWSHVPNPR
jgi:hypothetical protein